MRNKRGMYIVEAAIVMPIFIGAMALIINIIPIISSCENVVFSEADELRRDAAKAAFIDERLTLRATLPKRVIGENRKISSFAIGSYSGKYSSNGIDDLITLETSTAFRNDVTILPVRKILFGFVLTGRAFTGTTHVVSSDDDGTLVYIFPESGVRYHHEGCRYLLSHCRMTYLSGDLMAKYHACPLCGAKNAGLGTPVYYFEKAGEAYHLASCRSVEKEKYYTEVTRESAEAAGYTPCTVCGG